MKSSGFRSREAAGRRALVLTALREGRIGTQTELAAWLGTRGHAVTQSCVSHDLRKIGARKIGGRYRIAPERPSDLAGFAGLIERFAPAGPHLVVVRTLPGAAQRVGHAIDTAEWPEAAGSVAGDDTIFVASATPSGQRRILERLSGALGAGR